MIDHLSRLELPESEVKQQVQINDTFSDKQILAVSYSDVAPWFANTVNYLVEKVIPSELSSQQRNNFFAEVKDYY